MVHHRIIGETKIGKLQCRLPGNPC